MDKSKAGTSVLHTRELFSLLLSHFVLLGKIIPLCCLSFCEVKNWQRHPKKHVGTNVGQCSIEFGSPFSCLEGIKPWSLHLFMMKWHTFWKSCNYSISCFIAVLFCELAERTCGTCMQSFSIAVSFFPSLSYSLCLEGAGLGFSSPHKAVFNPPFPVII